MSHKKEGRDNILLNFTRFLDSSSKKSSPKKINQRDNGNFKEILLSKIHDDSSPIP
jgi:hypothetical protein